MRDDFSLPASIDGCLSLDRCTLLVWSPFLSVWQKDEKYKMNQRKIEKFLAMFLSFFANEDDKDTSGKILLDSDFSQGTKSKLFLYHFRTAKLFEGSEGIDIQFGACMPVRKRISDVDYLESFGTVEEKEQGFHDEYTASNYGFRLEWNPNKDDISILTPVLSAFSRLTDPNILYRVARLDIAIDYCGRLYPQFCICSQMYKSFLALGSSGVETVYFGSRASRYMVRIYDKKKELSEKQHIEIPQSDLWRVELESKAAFPLAVCPYDEFSKVFNRLSFFRGGLSSGDWLLDKLLELANGNGMKAALSGIPSTSRKRYLKRLEILSQVNGFGFEPPETVYRKQFPAVYGAFRNNVLKAFQYI